MILFLDFDGVLHPENSRTEPKFCRLPLLEAWLRQRPGVDVVISSSWREVHRLEELVGLFAPDLQGRVVGCTPLYSRMHPRDSAQLYGEAAPPTFKREAEIRRWMRDSWEPGRAWCALDDMPELFEPGCRQLVVCDSRVGLTAVGLLELDAHLGCAGYPE